MGMRSYFYPERDFNFRDIQSASREYEHARLKVLLKLIDGECDVVVSCIDAASQFTVPKEFLRDCVLTLKEGLEISIEKAVRTLTLLGYERFDAVEGSGQFSVRGGILDFFMPDAENPVRAEFWGDEITDLSFFDIDTQRRGEKAGEIRLSPSAEVIIEDRTVLADKIENLAKSVRGKKAPQVKETLLSEAAFEGLKAYRCPDGKVRVFRMDENAKRLQSTCRGILMPEVPTEMFEEMVKKVVRLNQEWIPTYESGATLYIRPLLIGTSAQVGVHPSKEYCFLIFVTPVGPYFKGGFSTNPYVIIRDFDRSAPLGTGIYKVGGNYAASLRANNIAHEKGYACEFYLDAKEKKYMDECGAANFFGIKNNTYVTPKSTSILPSITNKSLMQLAEDLGMKVERRQIPEDELDTFEEAGACGTAAVISPISYIDDLDTGKRYNFGEKPGPISTEQVSFNALYKPSLVLDGALI